MIRWESYKERRKNNLFAKIKGQLSRDGTSLQVEYEMLEQLNSFLLADAGCHDTFLQLKIKQKRRKCTSHVHTSKM